MLHTNCVPLAVYDRKCAEYDALIEKYHALKIAGAALPSEPKAGRVVQPGPSPEALAAKRLHDGLIGRLADDIKNVPGISPDVAHAEAERLRALAVGGSIMEPPV